MAPPPEHHPRHQGDVVDGSQGGVAVRTEGTGWFDHREATGDPVDHDVQEGSDEQTDDGDETCDRGP
jgi:hypothetical protein